MLGYGKLSKQQMAHESGGDNIGFEFSGYEVRMQPCSFCLGLTSRQRRAQDITTLLPCTCDVLHIESLRTQGVPRVLPRGQQALCRNNSSASHGLPWAHCGVHVAGGHREAGHGLF